MVQNIFVKSADLPPPGVERSARLREWTDSYHGPNPIIGLWSVIIDVLDSAPTSSSHVDTKLVLEFVRRDLDSITLQPAVMKDLAKALRKLGARLAPEAREAFLDAVLVFMTVPIAPRVARTDAVEGLRSVAEGVPLPQAQLKRFMQRLTTGVSDPHTLEAALGPRGWARMSWFLNEYLASRSVKLKWGYLIPGVADESVKPETLEEVVRGLLKQKPLELNLPTQTLVLWDGHDGFPLVSHELTAKKVKVFFRNETAVLFSAGASTAWSEPQRVDSTGLVASDARLSGKDEVLDAMDDGLDPTTLLPHRGKKGQLFRVDAIQRESWVRAGRNRRGEVCAVLVRSSEPELDEEAVD